MAKFIYTGDGEIVIPALGLTLTKGDQFEGPDDLINLLNVELASKAAKTAAATNTAPAADLAADEPPVTAESQTSPDLTASTDQTSN